MGFRNTNVHISDTEATELVQILSWEASALPFAVFPATSQDQYSGQYQLEKLPSFINYKGVSVKDGAYIVPLKCDQRKRMNK